MAILEVLECWKKLSANYNQVAEISGIGIGKDLSGFSKGLSVVMKKSEKAEPCNANPKASMPTAPELSLTVQAAAVTGSAPQTQTENQIDSPYSIAQAKNTGITLSPPGWSGGQRKSGCRRCC